MIIFFTINNVNGNCPDDDESPSPSPSPTPTPVITSHFLSSLNTTVNAPPGILLKFFFIFYYFYTSMLNAKGL